MRPHVVILPILLSIASTSLAGQEAQRQAPRPFTVERVGTGEPMILIPGLLSSGEVWTTTIERYKARYDMHVLTLAGFGGGPAPDGAFLPVVRDAVIAYIRDTGLKRPIVVGHSLGGFLAFWIATTVPDQVGAVIAVDGVPYLGALMNPTATPDAARPQAEQLRALYASFTPQQLRAQSQMSLAGMITSPADVERALGWVDRSDPRAAGQAMFEMLTTDLREAVGAIGAPVLLVGAAEFARDEATQQRVRAAYEAQVARVKTRTVTLATTARHFIMLDAPDALWSAMDTFLAAQPRPVAQ